MTFLTVGDAYKDGQNLTFDFYLSEDQTPMGVPPRKILKHKTAHVKFVTPRDAQAVFDILTMAIQSFEVVDK